MIAKEEILISIATIVKIHALVCNKSSLVSENGQNDTFQNVEVKRTINIKPSEWRAGATVGIQEKVE